MWDIVWFSPQGHKSVAAWFRFFLQTQHWPCAVWKRLSRDRCCRGRLKPGCRIVGTSTKEKLTTQADFQFSFHDYWCPPVSDPATKASWVEDRHADGWWYHSELASCHELVFCMSLSVVAFLRRAGGSVLASGDVSECPTQPIQSTPFPFTYPDFLSL